MTPSSTSKDTGNDAGSARAKLWLAYLNDPDAHAPSPELAKLMRGPCTHKRYVYPKKVSPLPAARGA